MGCSCTSNAPVTPKCDMIDYNLDFVVSPQFNQRRNSEGEIIYSSSEDDEDEFASIMSQATKQLRDSRSRLYSDAQSTTSHTSTQSFMTLASSTSRCTNFSHADDFDARLQDMMQRK